LIGSAFKGTNTKGITCLHGVMPLMAAVSYFVLQRAIIAAQGRGSVLKAAIGSDWKGRLSMVAYAMAIPASFWSPAIGWAIGLRHEWQRAVSEPRSMP
jgi:sorbitol-specific phosphotransferase system component IIBC